ncbi:MAG: 50S ribosomal protein L32 [Candidatus Buchananbacteria bacterium RIFCSPHIGHO2_01_FULL_44_11]|uniref:Large ribosomal subunit protein bL32 n=1 Tax=Candidatus Buchananbacteria bacterium RIFCSPHIGHO2_01_FULL_44_11 TaxID=1797535 RepID=A0A1G1Y1Y8_9BACT|nr:MAG: 50S ribosomal protein L32 [Candidatus Buchananbacteria bacterium RIFCSPHIGHO2_01_FULL_44_11]
MPVPAHRKSSSFSRMGRAHKKITQPKLTKCPKCKKPTLPHQTCLFCGYYQGRQVIKIKEKKAKAKK